ncbi:helix-turn-helix domain-containing protein [Trichothermofontia sp.]
MSHASPSLGQITDFTPELRRQMQAVGIPSFAALEQRAGVSRGQIRHLRQGQAGGMSLDVLLRLSRSLQMPLLTFLETFTPPGTLASLAIEAPACPSPVTASTDLVTQLAAYAQEYEQLQAQVAQQQRSLLAQFQRDSLDMLEPWLRSWPKAEAAVANKPDLPAERLLKLVQPIKQLLHHWGVEAIGSVGAIVPFDPQLHQLQGEMVAPGERVQVVNVGYRQGDRLLWRAEVKLATAQP